MLEPGTGGGARTPKVIVATYPTGPDPVVVYGPFNDEQAARKVAEWVQDNAALDPDGAATYTVCDLR